MYRLSFRRLANWKAVRLSPAGKVELYDLAEDIGEERDVAADHPEGLEQGQSQLQRRLDQAQ